MAKPSSAKEQDNLVCQDVIRNGLDRAVDVTQTSRGRSAKCPRPHEPSRQRAAHRFSQARREATEGASGRSPAVARCLQQTEITVRRKLRAFFRTIDLFGHFGLIGILGQD